ncbi:DUF1680 family protein [Aequitasia blattaphilus]|uniref:Glycoside hydrolase family 127 protein n=1 Tax=Aequitasia blattaphilus TaxID=2949332 RepID=A0ABT1EAZ4_9FIRM|nr:beta-L-arabinofuranosidase domain-containing protein [Aequitasia blattaphilus]MCP1103000.1 glycoside hydrolase family 127 protein [Aequitasia blattaphilus]MCR8615640.1 glycoside hydrolase family 127 protein [Aequitasia blattaphilus]
MKQYRLLKKQEWDIDDHFWNYYTKLVRETVIPYQWEILNDRIPDSEPSHGIDNFRIAAKDMDGNFYGEVFQDSDVAKWLEAVGNILMLKRDEDLEAKADEAIAIIERAQEPDGYLNTYFSIEAPEKKWTNVLECHELYCAGHFIEGAISYYLATGKEKVYKIALRLADHICDVFGPEEKKLHGYPGHQEIEIALLKLYDVSGEKRYLELSKYFIDTRGTNQFFEEEFEKRNRICQWTNCEVEYPNRWYNQFPYTYYNQFHLPVREQEEPVGHAVRGLYMYTAMADLAARTKDQELFCACRKIWNNIVTRQMYITGGVGSTHSGEAFTTDYDLPNDTNYAETCASIGLLFFAQKMLKTEVDNTYGDTMERALYNTILGGMNYEGNRFFYVNPLEVVPETCSGNTERNHVKPTRQKWFSCACCPPNIARTIGGLWQYIYTANEDSVFVHLYIGGKGKIELSGNELEIHQETSYPWGDTIHFDIKSTKEKEASVAFRIPSWSSTYTLELDGEEVSTPKNESGYVIVKGDWSKGRKVKLQLDMTPRLMEANQKVHYNAGRIAITRGPIVYCLEEYDNGKYLNQLTIDTKAKPEEIPSKDWQDVVVIQTKGYRKKPGDERELYALYQEGEEEVKLTAVPYFLWNNRSDGEMLVWMRSGR